MTTLNNTPTAPSRLARVLNAPAVQVTARVLAGVAGGYALTYLAIGAMTLWLPWSRAEVALYASAGCFLLYLGAIIYAFAETRLWRLWGILTLLLVLLSAAVWRGLP